MTYSSWLLTVCRKMNTSRNEVSLKACSVIGMRGAGEDISAGGEASTDTAKKASDAL
jgi:hypothetical protein